MDHVPSGPPPRGPLCPRLRVNPVHRGLVGRCCRGLAFAPPRPSARPSGPLNSRITPPSAPLPHAPTGTTLSRRAWTRPPTLGISLPAYNYFNFGAGYALPNTGTRINVDLLNAFQGKGLEEGNPRLLGTGGNPIFLARPILPRRFMVSVTYDFGGPQ